MSTRKDITKTGNKEIEQTRERPAITPAVDIYENDEELLVVADVPGVPSDGIRLNFENNQLTIEASSTPFEVEGTGLFQEFVEVDYRRAFQVASGIDAEKISAELKNGIVNIHLPKSAALKPRQIPVTTE